VSEPIVLRVDAVDVLVADLTGLAGEMSTGADECRSASPSLAAALPGEAGSVAAAAVTGWAAYLESLAQQIGSWSAALGSICAEYRVVDAALAAGLVDDGSGQGGGR
jgi:hypothetical protein